MTSLPRRAAVAAALGCLVVLGASVSCSSTAAPVGPESGTDAGPAPVPPGLERYYVQALAWGPCLPYARTDAERHAYADARFECARLEVPLDYAAPDGRTAQVAVLRDRTPRPGRVGSLVVNPGGPGGSGMSLAAARASALADGPFDVVGFDPRGVGASTPALRCQTPAEFDAYRAQDADPSPAGVAATERESRDIAAHCVERSGGADVVANAGTRDVARDLDVLRAALGDRRLTYLGYSYGTRIGVSYAEMFPGNVRAMVLDGVVDPAQGTEDSVVAQMAGFQQAFQAYATSCARTPDCPLGADPARATARFQALTRPLLGRPAPAGARRLSYGDAITGTIRSLYGTDYWPRLTTGLRGLAAGDGAELLGLADEYHERGVDGGYPDTHAALLVVNCMDGDRVDDPRRLRALAARTVAAAPFLDDGRGPSPARDACAFLPAPSGRPHPPVAPALPPVLVVSTTGDPATPYDAGVRVARALGGSLLTVEGVQHTAAAEGHPCVDDVVADYLAGLVRPADGARCALPTP